MADSNALTNVLPRAQRYRIAYQQVLPEIMAVPKEQLQPVTVDVISVIARSIGTIEQVHALREQAAQLPFFDITHFDKFELHARARSRAYAASGGFGADGLAAGAGR